MFQKTRKWLRQHIKSIEEDNRSKPEDVQTEKKIAHMLETIETNPSALEVFLLEAQRNGIYKKRNLSPQEYYYKHIRPNAENLEPSAVAGGSQTERSYFKHRMSKNTASQQLPIYPVVKAPGSLQQNNQLGKAKVSWMKPPHITAHRTRTYTPTLSWSPKRFGDAMRGEKGDTPQEIFYTRSDSMNKNHIMLNEP